MFWVSIYNNYFLLHSRRQETRIGLCSHLMIEVSWPHLIVSWGGFKWCWNLASKHTQDENLMVDKSSSITA
jgi:hypothetical protein